MFLNGAPKGILYFEIFWMFDMVLLSGVTIFWPYPTRPKNEITVYMLYCF